MKLNEKQRDKIAGVLIDVGKIIFTALVVGQFLPTFSQTVSVGTLTFGFIVSVFCWTLGVAFVGKENSP